MKLSSPLTRLLLLDTIVMSNPPPTNSPTLKELLEEKGISKVALYEATKVREDTIRKWQRGATTPRIDLAIKVSAVLGISLKTFCRSIGLDVEALPDDVATPPPPPNLDEVIADAERTLAMLKSLAAQKKA
jgi:transcriptional regulator with XRE-family HTH domain